MRVGSIKNHIWHLIAVAGKCIWFLARTSFACALELLLLFWIFGSLGRFGSLKSEASEKSRTSTHDCTCGQVQSVSLKSCGKRLCFNFTAAKRGSCKRLGGSIRHTQWLLVRLSLLSWPIRAALRCGRCDERATSCSSLQMRCQPSRLRHPSQVCMGSLSRKHKLRVASIGSVAHAPPPPSTSTSMAADALLRAHSCPSERASRILVGSQSQARTTNNINKLSRPTERNAAQRKSLT